MYRSDKERIKTTMLCLRTYRHRMGKYIERKILKLIKDINCIKTRLMIHQYFRKKDFPIEEFIELLKDNNAIISGSLVCKYYMELDFENNDVDIFIEYKKLNSGRYQEDDDGEYCMDDITEWILENCKCNIYNEKIRDSYTLINGLNYSKKIILNNDITFNIITVLCDPYIFIQKNFDIDCCKIIYDGYGVDIQDDIHFNINNMITYCKPSPVCDIRHVYASSYIPENNFPELPIFKEFDILKSTYDYPHIYTKYSKYIDIMKEKINLNDLMDDIREICIDEYNNINIIIKLSTKTWINYFNIIIKIMNYVRYLDRLEKYKNRGFTVIN